MSRPSGRRSTWWRTLSHELARERLHLARESGYLLVLGTLDLLMTYVLMRLGMGFFEANPVAQWWFARWNIAGMTVFKFLCLTVAIMASEVVERRRPGVGRAVLILGCVAAFGAVVYGLYLLLRTLSLLDF